MQICATQNYSLLAFFSFYKKVLLSLLFSYSGIMKTSPDHTHDRASEIDRYKSIFNEISEKLTHITTLAQAYAKLQKHNLVLTREYNYWDETLFIMGFLDDDFNKKVLTPKQEVLFSYYTNIMQAIEIAQQNRRKVWNIIKNNRNLVINVNEYCQRVTDTIRKLRDEFENEQQNKQSRRSSD